MKIVRRLVRELFDVVSFLVFVAGIVLFIRFFIFNPFTVVGSSMEPTISEKDVLIVDKITPRLRDYKRNDVIVFVPPGRKEAYVKRIIGLPGETIVMQNGAFYICDFGQTDRKQCEEYEQDYLPPGSTLPTSFKTTFDVTDEGYFVVGDNRANSSDSRSCFGAGCSDETPYLVPSANIIGKVSLRLFPVGSISLF